MPYIKRDNHGQITALLKEAAAETDSFLPADHPEVVAFLGDGQDTGGSFDVLDRELVRVLEDLVDTLIQKNILRITDLPPEAQHKLLNRKRLRSQLNPSLGFLGRADDLI